MIEDLLKQHEEEIFKDLFTFLRFPSISTNPESKPAVLACANWLQTYLERSSLTVEKWESEGLPILFATNGPPDPAKETLLIYGHYDVQPVDPLDAWLSPPFEPTIREGNIYARGAQDDKGQIFYAIWAIKLLIEAEKELPVNLKLLIEGEEESGSSSLFAALEEKKEKLQADHLLIVDSVLEKEGMPAITLGARGICCLNVMVTGSKTDLHSGWMGGVAYNPNRALVEMLAALHDTRGRVTVPGFYDAVTSLTEEEKAAFPFTYHSESYEALLGHSPTGMEEGLTPLEAAWLSPTLEINGVAGGYAGAGFKTVIPAKATAKLSCRLVPDQDPHTIAESVRTHLHAHTPPGITCTVDILPGYGTPFRTSPHSTIARAAHDAYTQVFQKPCEPILIGGTIPIAADLAATSGADMVLIGVGLPDDQIHAPNEHFSLSRFKQGLLTTSLIFQCLKT